MMSTDRAIRTAAIIFITYGIAVVLNAAVWQTIGQWQDARGFARAIIRLVGMVLIARGLLTRARWAWWAGVLLPGFWILALLAFVVAYIGLGASEEGSPFPLPMLLFTAASGLALTVAVGILLSRQVREAFRTSQTQKANG